MVLQSILELNIKETLSDYVTAIAWSLVGNTLAARSGSGEVILLKNFVRFPCVNPQNNRSIAWLFHLMENCWQRLVKLDYFMASSTSGLSSFKRWVHEINSKLEIQNGLLLDNRHFEL